MIRFAGLQGGLAVSDVLIRVGNIWYLPGVWYQICSYYSIKIIQTLQTFLKYTTEVARLPPQNTIFLQLLPCLAQHPSAFTSRCPTEKEGRGASELPPEDFYVFHSFKPCRRQAKQTNAPALQTSKAKQTLESMPPQNSKH